MSQIHIDPATGRRYEIGFDGVSRWVDADPPAVSLHYRPEPAKKSHKVRNTILGVLGGFLALGVIGSLLNGDETTTTTAGKSTAAAKAPAKSSAKAAAKPAAAAPKIGTAVRDGKFQFTVTGTKTASQVGDQYLNKKAQGQFLLVSVTVANIGDKAQMFDSSSQKLYDTAGREYSADAAAGIYLGEAGKSFLEQINPGNSVKGTVVFDVPAGTKLDKIELHDSMFSGGVDVKLVK